MPSSWIIAASYFCQFVGELSPSQQHVRQDAVTECWWREREIYQKANFCIFDIQTEQGLRALFYGEVVTLTN